MTDISTDTPRTVRGSLRLRILIALGAAVLVVLWLLTTLGTPLSSKFVEIAEPVDVGAP